MMRRIARVGLIAGCLWAADEKRLTVRAVATKTEDHTRVGAYTTPNSQQTVCSGTANTMGQTTTGTATCQTVGQPSQTIPVKGGYLTIYNQVEADGMTYLLTCNTSLFRGCAPLIVGDSFPMALKGTEATLEGPRGGNMGKMVKVKFRLLDMRPTAEATPLK